MGVTRQLADLFYVSGDIQKHVVYWKVKDWDGRCAIQRTFVYTYREYYRSLTVV
jgi:hypothetical protein